MIVYDKLGDYLKSKNMKYIDLQRELALSPSMTAKFTKNRTISTDTLNKVCEYLKIQPSDIMEVIPNTWENADRLCEILGSKNEPLSKEDLPSRVPMESQ